MKKFGRFINNLILSLIHRFKKQILIGFGSIAVIALLYFTLGKVFTTIIVLAVAGFYVYKKN